MSKEVNINIKGSTEINDNPNGLLEASPVYKPFRYPWAYDMWLMQQRLHWLPEEVNMSEDVKDWNNKLKDNEIHLITQIFRFFTQADCFPIKTRLLTSTGFKSLCDLKPHDRVAQVSLDGTLSFVKPLVSSNAIKHKNEGNVIHFTGNDGRFNISVTENHNMFFKRDGELIKQKAKDIEFKNGDQIIVGVTPKFTGEHRELSQIERLKIAFNERGSKTNIDGECIYVFSPSDENERHYLHRLLHSEMRLTVETKKVKHEGEDFTYLTVSSLDDKDKLLDVLRGGKTYDWINLEKISSAWCESFIKEIGIYGHIKNNGEVRYFNQNKNFVEKIQIVSLLGGCQAFIESNKTPDGHNGYSLDIIKQGEITLNNVKKSVEKSDEMVSCVKVPEGNILVERNGIPVVTGNCEVNNAYTHIYSQIFKPFEIQMMLSCFSNIECFDKESELLTDSGWKFCPDIKETDKIAQYNKETGEISFVLPNKVVSYPYNGIMHHYKNEKTDIMVTPNHDLILKNPTSGKVAKKKSLEGEWGEGYLYPTASSSFKDEIIKNKEQYKDADIIFPESNCDLTVEEAQKIIKSILSDEEKVLLDTKDSCLLVVDNKDSADKIQAISVLAGISAEVNKNDEEYIVTLNNNYVWREYPHRKDVSYNDKVYCVSVPHQNLVSRRNGCVAITGNTIHVAAYSHLLDTIGMPETEYSAFLKYKEMKDKFEAMHDYHITDKKGIALAIATFSGFMEGLQLFASFAILLNFPRHNRLKGMGQIVSWSVRDETCVSDDTEVLTSKGWKLFKDLDKTELLAQFEGKDNEITFAKPLHYTKKRYKGNMIHIYSKNNNVNILVTPDHDIVLRCHDGLIKVKATDLHKYKDIYEFPIGSENDNVAIDTWIPVENLSFSQAPYDGTVYCATMPKGTIVTRRNGSIGFIGNCHVVGMIKLFRTFIAENPEIWTEDFRKSIKEICIECVKHEDAFIDLAFELGGVNGLEADEVKRYIRFIADRRLQMMSIDPIYNIEENPLPWVDDMVNAVEHTNFFENRATEYSRAGTTGTWDDAFQDKNFFKNGKLPSVDGSKWI